MKNIKVSKEKHTLADELIKRTSSMLDEIAPKTVYKTKKVINRGKKIKTLNEVKLVKSISKNSQIFLEISPAQKEAHPSHKLQNHAHE